MASYEASHLDEIKAEQWPYWAPIRHRFDIRAFGANAWRGSPGDEVIKRHSERESGHEELYMVLSGRATFTVGADDVDAPAGTCIFIRDPEIERVAFAQEDGTVVLSLGGWAGKAFEPSQWELDSLS
jgi:quercetin dioxygenase-like cupin family protein